MLDFTGAVNPSPVAIADALVTEADAEDRKLIAKLADNIIGDAGTLWGTWAWRDDNTLG